MSKLLSLSQGVTMVNAGLQKIPVVSELSSGLVPKLPINPYTSLPSSLADCSWTQIKEISNIVAADPSEYQNYIGQEKIFTCLGTTFTAVCVDVAHFEKQNGSGKAGFVFQFKETTVGSYKINSTKTTVGGYVAMDMYKTTLPDTIFTTMQDELKNAIVEVKFPYNIYSNGSESGDNAFTSAETHAKLFLPSNREVWGIAPLNSSGSAASETYHTGNDGTQFAYWAQHPTVAEHIKYEVGASTTEYWWCRSCSAGGTSFVVVTRSGYISQNIVNISYPVAPCFCI